MEFRRTLFQERGNAFLEIRRRARDTLRLEFQSQRAAGSTADFKEGITAFLEKRPAKFQGK